MQMLCMKHGLVPNTGIVRGQLDVMCDMTSDLTLGTCNIRELKFPSAVGLNLAHKHDVEGRGMWWLLGTGGGGRL